MGEPFSEVVALSLDHQFRRFPRMIVLPNGQRTTAFFLVAMLDTSLDAAGESMRIVELVAKGAAGLALGHIPPESST